MRPLTRTDNPAHRPVLTTCPSSSLNSITLPCCPTTGSDFQYLPGPGDSSSGAYRTGSNVRFHPHVCGGSDQHVFVHTRPVGFIVQNVTLTAKISVGFSNSVCLVSGLKGVNITATVGLVIHAAGTLSFSLRLTAPAWMTWRCFSIMQKPQIN